MEFAMKIPEDMRKKYLQRRASDAEEIAVALDAGKFEVLLKVGHQLKGNAPTFGYETLAELGHKMEEAAERESLAEARECLCALKAWVQEQQYGAGEDG